jgi:hypothetical protein
LGGIFRIPDFGLEEICYFLLSGFGVQQQPGPYLGTVLMAICLLSFATIVLFVHFIFIGGFHSLLALGS